MSILKGTKSGISNSYSIILTLNSAGQRPWQLFATKPRSLTTGGCKGLTCPKPDWAAFFPMYSTTYSESLCLPRNWKWSALSQSSLLQTFSPATFSHLAKFGLFANPTVSAKQHRDTGLPLRLRDYKCFPWLIVEHNHSKTQAKLCHWQAANAGHAALHVLETLSRHRHEDGEHQETQIPPIITITTRGAEVCVWAVYRDGDATVGIIPFAVSQQLLTACFTDNGSHLVWRCDANY